MRKKFKIRGDKKKFKIWGDPEQLKMIIQNRLDKINDIGV